MRNKKRRKTFIDRPVQGQLLFRVFVYWSLCMSGVFCILAGVPIVLSWFLTSGDAPTISQLVLQTWRMFWPALFASGLLLPFLLLDVVRMSHRFAGPMYRLRNALRDAADGKAVAPIHFRDGDFWCEMAEEFNQVAARLRDLEPAVNGEKQSTCPTNRDTSDSVAL